MKKAFAFAYVLLLCDPLFAEDTVSIIHSFLSNVQSKSLKIKSLENQKRFELYEKDQALAVLDSKGFLKGNVTDEKLAPTSPFAASERKVYEYGFGLEKQWAAGFKTKFSYGLRDSSTSFPSRDNFNFIAPRVQVSLESNLFQDIFSNRYRHLEKKVRFEKVFIQKNDKINQKNILIQSLLDFALILERKEEFKLQVSLCQKTRVQAKKLSRKRKTLSISKREYFLSLKELEKCEAAVEELSKKTAAKTHEFEARYSVSYEPFKNLGTSVLLNQFKEFYQKIRASTENSNLDINSVDSHHLMELELQVLKEKQRELNSRVQPDVFFEFRLGTSGLDSDKGYENAIDFSHPFAYFGVKMDFPFENREFKARAMANYYRLKALGYEKNLLAREVTQEIKTLEQNLEKDFIIHKKYQKSVELSEAILKEATRDFSNGRIDFFSLTEFNKGIIQEQKILSAHRIQLIIKVVEFLNYHRFFNQFFVQLQIM